MKPIHKIIIISFLIFYFNCNKITDPITVVNEKESISLTYTKAKLDSFLQVDGVWIAGPETTPCKIIEGGWKSYFSRDGNYIAYYKIDVTDNQYYVKLYLHDLINHHNKKLTTIAIDGYPSYIISSIQWSHDDKKLAYSADKSDGVDIYVFNIETNNEERITNTNHSIRPAWSYDDRAITCWTLINDQVYKIATVDADGTDYRLIDINGLVSSPNWLPDGRIIAGIKPGGLANKEDIIIMNTDGSNIIHLTDDHNSFFVDLLDNDHIIVTNYPKSDSLYFDILNIHDKTREHWFKMDGNFSFKLSNQRNLIAYLKNLNFSPTSSLYVKNLITNDEFLLDDNVLDYELSWCD